MIRRRIYILPLLLAFMSWGLLQQAFEGGPLYHDYVGFSLMPGANSSPVTFHIVRKYDDPALPIDAWNIDKHEFMCIASGMEKCSANPDGENFFVKFDVRACGYVPDTIIHLRFFRGGLSCSTIDDIWKLRYKVWPFAVPIPPQNAQQQQSVNTPGVPGSGWARDTLGPSDGQIMILKQYGIPDYISPIYGDNAFRLLHDMQDPAWVSKYAGS